MVVEPGMNPRVPKDANFPEPFFWRLGNLAKLLAPLHTLKLLFFIQGAKDAKKIGYARARDV